MNPKHGAARKLPIGTARTGRCLIALAVLAGGLAGCRTFNKHITEAVLDGGETKQWNIHYGSTHRYRLNNESLEEIAFEGTVEGPRISVRYQKGLADQAGQIAEQTAQMLEQVEQRIGMEITTRSTIQLLRFDAPPQNFTIHLTVEPNEFPLPMFVRAGDESYGSILAQNPSQFSRFVSSGFDGATSLGIERSRSEHAFIDGLTATASFSLSGSTATTMSSPDAKELSRVLASCKRCTMRDR